MPVPFIPVYNTARVNLIYNVNAQEAQNVFHFQQAAPFSVSEMSTLAGAVKTWWNSYLKAGFTASVALQRIDVVSLESQFAPGISYATGLPLTGTAAGLALPNNCAAILSWKTALRGRAYRGRTYLPSPPLSFQDHQDLTTAAVTQYTSAVTAFLLPATWPSCDPVIVSRFLNNLPRSAGVCTLIESGSVGVGIVTQRRRMPGA